MYDLGRGSKRDGTVHSAMLKVVLAVLFAAAALHLMPPVGRAGEATLSDGDCIKCHAATSDDIALAGASHRDVTCSGCHVGHPPRSQAAIPRCGQCHEGEDHFRKEGCFSCHANPHMPLRIVMPSDRSEVCLECHASPVILISRGRSLHSGLTCSECHAGHRQRPNCQDCHDAHQGGSQASSCTGCHEPHMPMPVIYALSIPSAECGACHREAYELLLANSTGHGRRSCASCHQKRHGVMPTCASCHGLPHRLTAEALFAECHRCHRTAHDLVVWPEEDAAGQEDLVIPQGILRYIELGKNDPRR